MNNHLLAIFLSFLFVFLFRPCTCIVQNSRHPDEWFEELERQWIDEGRLPELTEDEILYRRTMKRREAAADKMDKYMRKPLTKQKDAAGMATNLDRIGRPVLMHITLTQEYVEANKDSDKDDLTWDQKADRCDEWLVRPCNVGINQFILIRDNVNLIDFALFLSLFKIE